MSRIEGHQLEDGIFEQVRLAEMWKLYGGVFRLQSSAPPLTEHLPPPSILMEEGGTWLVGTPLAEQKNTEYPSETDITEVVVEDLSLNSTQPAEEVDPDSEVQGAAPQELKDDMERELKEEELLSVKPVKDPSSSMDADDGENIRDSE